MAKNGQLATVLNVLALLHLMQCWFAMGLPLTRIMWQMNPG